MKKFIAFILAALIITAVVPMLATAANEETGTEYYSLPIIDKDIWEPLYGVRSISQRSNSQAEIVYASVEEDAKSASFKASFEPADLSRYAELALDISVRGEDESYPLTVALASKDASVQYSFTVSTDSHVIYAPLEDTVSDDLREITVTVEGTAGSISYVMVGSVIADNTFTYSYTELFSATDILSNNKTEKTAGSVTVYPEDSAADLTPLFTAIPEKGHTALVWLETDGDPGGSLYVRATYPDRDDETTEHLTSAVSLSTAGVYSFAIPGGFTDVSFEFTALTSNDTLTVISGGCTDMGKTDESAGAITACQYDGKELSVSGNLSTDASLKYLGSKLLLFRIPADKISSFDPKKEKPVAQSGFSTKFTLSFDCDMTYARYLYKVVIDTSDGYLPVGSVCVPDSKATAKKGSGSVSCLYGADTADVFEATVSSVILDVCAGKLFESEDIYSALSYSFGSTYYFNKDYLLTIDKDVRFFSSSGVNVYLRIYSDKDGYAFEYNANDPENLTLMCAVTTFLSERYPSVAGFIAGVPFNDKDTDPTLLEEKARLTAAFAESIKQKSPDAAVIIPFSDGGKADFRLAASILFYYLNLYHAPSVSLMIEGSSSPEGLSDSLSSLMAVTAQQGISAEDGSILWKIPSSQDTASAVEGYRSLCTDAAAAKLRFVAADLSVTNRSRELYDSLKKMLDSENVISTSLSRFEASLSKGDFKGTYPVWDFTSSYDTAGWVGGGSFSDPISDRGTLGGRALSASLKGTGSEAGILIAKADAPIDMSGYTARITFCVNSDTAKNAEVSFIFGNGDSRAEYFATVECNKESTLLCDMSSFVGAERIDYASLILRGISDGRAEISKVELCSNTLTSEEMTDRLSPKEAKGGDPVFYALIIFLAATTVAVFSVLLKKQRSKTEGVKK